MDGHIIDQDQIDVHRVKLRQDLIGGREITVPIVNLGIPRPISGIDPIPHLLRGEIASLPLHEQFRKLIASYFWGRIHILHNVKEHAPPLARASVDHGVRVEVKREHVNRAASGGCVSRLVRLLVCLFSRFGPVRQMVDCRRAHPLDLEVKPYTQQSH